MKSIQTLVALAIAASFASVSFAATVPATSVVKTETTLQAAPAGRAAPIKVAQADKSAATTDTAAAKADSATKPSIKAAKPTTKKQMKHKAKKPSAPVPTAS